MHSGKEISEAIDNDGTDKRYLKAHEKTASKPKPSWEIIMMGKENLAGERLRNATRGRGEEMCYKLR